MNYSLISESADYVETIVDGLEPEQREAVERNFRDMAGAFLAGEDRGHDEFLPWSDSDSAVAMAIVLLLKWGGYKLPSSVDDARDMVESLCGLSLKGQN